jgi:hypothetical protein
MMSDASSPTSYFRSPEAIFISHATEDEDFVRTLAERLRQKGFEAWHQPEMAPGGNYMAEIEARLDGCKAGIVVWSRSSVKKEFVQAEANRLRERECLVPVYIEECRPPAIFGLIQGIKCRDERSLANEEVLALCAAVNKILILSNKDAVLGQNDKVRNSTVGSRIVRALPALHVHDLLIGVVLGVVLGYSLFQWSQSPARADLEEFKKIAGAVPREADRITPETIFPDSKRPITFARVHIPNSGWPTVIVDQWEEHYQAQKRFVAMYCQDLNDLKKVYRQTFLATRKSNYLKQENSKTYQEPEKGDTTQTLSTDRNQALSGLLKTTRCLGDEGSSALVAEALMLEPDR